MKGFAIRDAEDRFGPLLEAAQSEPVRVVERGRAVGVLMSVEQFERLRGAVWDRLQAAMDGAAAEAAASGLTGADLDVLLDDES